MRKHKKNKNIEEEIYRPAEDINRLQEYSGFNEQFKNDVTSISDYSAKNYFINQQNYNQDENLFNQEFTQPLYNDFQNNNYQTNPYQVEYQPEYQQYQYTQYQNQFQPQPQPQPQYQYQQEQYCNIETFVENPNENLNDVQFYREQVVADTNIGYSQFDDSNVNNKDVKETYYIPNNFSNNYFNQESISDFEQKRNDFVKQNEFYTVNNDEKSKTTEFINKNYIKNVQLGDNKAVDFAQQEFSANNDYYVQGDNTELENYKIFNNNEVVLNNFENEEVQKNESLDYSEFKSKDGHFFDAISSLEENPFEENAISHRKNLVKRQESINKYPSFKLRFKSGLLDLIIFIMGIVMFFFTFIFPYAKKMYDYFMVLGGKTYLDLVLEIKGRLIGFVFIIIGFAFVLSVVIPKILKGQTIGQRINKIRVVSNFIDENDYPTIIQLFKREFVGKFLSFLGLGIPFKYKKGDKMKQNFADKFSNTHIETGNPY